MVQIITDSTCDISKERQHRMKIEVIPITVNFGDESFKDGIDISNEEFYEKLRNVQVPPFTTQINPDEFLNHFKPHIQKGNEVVGIFLASSLSGTFQSAVIAKDELESDLIHLVDSNSVTFGLGLLVGYAVMLRDNGCSAQEIAEKVTLASKRLRILAVIDSLKYLKMGGRISSTSAVVGGLLGINPILSVRDGQVLAAGKARGRAKAFSWMEHQMENEPVDHSMPIAFGHSDCSAVMKECEAYFIPKLGGNLAYSESDIGSVVGTHTGPGSAGIAYFVKN